LKKELCSLHKSLATNKILKPDKEGGKDQRKDFHLKVLICSYEALALGIPGKKFDLGARAWLFSQLHRHNGFKIRGGLEETPAQGRLGDQTFWRVIFFGKMTP